MIGFIILMATGQAYATPLVRPGQPIKIFGGGDASCAKAWQTDTEVWAKAWVLGFWTGLNAANGKKIGGQTDEDGVIGEVRKQCNDEPSMLLISATTRAYIQMSKR